MAWPKPRGDLFHNAKSFGNLCDGYAHSLGELATAIAAHLPELYPELRLVGMGQRWHETPGFDWLAAEKELRRIEAAAVSHGKIATTKRTRRGITGRKPRPLTRRQTEVIQVMGECKGNIARAAKQLGRNRKSIEECYQAGMEKLGKTVYHSKDKTRLLPRDRRGQETLSEDDDLRRPTLDDE